MNNFHGNKQFVIHANDAGTEAFTAQYVQWLERQVAQATGDRSVVYQLQKRLAAADAAVAAAITANMWLFSGMPIGRVKVAADLNKALFDYAMAKEVFGA